MVDGAVQTMVVQIVVAALLTGVALAAVAERAWADQTRARLVSTGLRPSVRAAFDRLVSAQGRFRSDVTRFEAARAQATVAAHPASGLAGSDSPLEVLERAKDRSRRELIDARSALQRLRPADLSRPEAGGWFGMGLVSSWGLGLFGRERLFIRVEHEQDENTWAVLELRRWRIGFGLGAEWLRLGIRAEAATPGSLVLMLQAAIDDADVALRPGFSPKRALSALRRREADRRAHRLLRERSNVGDLRSGLDEEERAMLRALLASNHSRSQRDGAGEPTLHLSASGPTMMVGLWRGLTRPRPFLLASSGQQIWEPASLARSR